MAALSLHTLVKLNNGNSLQCLGFGVALTEKTEESVGIALEAGYRLIDSARHYKNEEMVANAIRNSKLPREEIYLTTKIMSEEHGVDATMKAVEDSLTSTGLTYFDLILLHDPKAGREKRLQAYRALGHAQEKGHVRNIGVSNYGVKHLSEISEAQLPAPAVNQIELHPWNQQKDIVEYCEKNGVLVQAFCPLVRSRKMDDPILIAIAEEVGKTPGQVLVRWSLQHGFVPLPKSETPSRIRDNISIFDFELNDAQMQKLDDLDQGKAGSCSWNPVDAE